MEKRNISLRPFEVKVEPTKYLLKASADVWYDLIGMFHIYDVRNKEFLQSILIKNNSKKYEEVAKFCYEFIMPLEDFELLTPYSEFETLYKIIKDKPILKQKATQSFYDDYVENIAGVKKEIKYFDFDCSNEKLKISETIKSIPQYVRDWSRGSSSAFDEIFIYDKINEKFIYHFNEFCPYETDDEEITDNRQSFVQFFSTNDDYIMLVSLNPYQNLWLFENNELSKMLNSK